ncbi:MAG: cystathionine gamma-synthase [Solirubrobacteraceae bacterium]
MTAGKTNSRDSRHGFATLAIHASQPPDATTGSVIPALHLATTYAQSAVGEHKGFEYSRTGNPTRATLEGTMAALEGGERAFCFASGMASEDALLRLTKPGDHVIIPNDAYGGTYRLIARVYGNVGLEHTPVDLTDPLAVAAAWRPETRFVWIETPSNPLLRVVDIEAVASVAHANGGLCIVDNTFATPYLQQPLSLGADAVIHSATKYLGGHSDVVGGCVVTSNQELTEHLTFIQNATGAVPSPFDCYLVQRGLKTLAVRLDRQCSNAMAVAHLLAEHPAVSAVHYPGLPTHPGHDLAKRQMSDFGAMVSFTLTGGEAAALEAVKQTALFTLAESLGAVESLIEHPARMTHASVVGSALEVDPALVRLSVGLETVSDLIDDLLQALG